jgi:hypothetical protein
MSLPPILGQLSVALNEGEQGCTLVSDRVRWDTKMPVGYIANKSKYLHTSAAEIERREEKMRILQARFK